MINIIDEKNCCGCAACVSICPKNCIELEEKTLGALIPKVNLSQCINCHMCESVCPIINKPKSSDFIQSAYAAYSKNDEERMQGSSGGLFGVFAKAILNNHGVVYGAAFDGKMKLKCNYAENEEQLKPLYKSKYLQSNLLESYEKIENDLKNDKMVLFVSTPCQVSALKLYLKKSYDNLITIDFFCHGVPSQKFFDECIKYEDIQKNIKTTSYEFRSKIKNGSTPHYFTRTYHKNGKEKQDTNYYFKSIFYAAFQQYVTLRESCYNCKYADKNRVSDITIGDFHEIDKYVGGINRFDGVSTVIVNTQKGEQLLENISEKLQIYSVNIDQLIKDKVIFSGATKRPKHRDEFVKCYDDYGVSGIAKKYLNQRKYIKNQIYYDMPKSIRKLIKK